MGLVIIGTIYNGWDSQGWIQDFLKGGRARGLWDGSGVVGSRGKALVESLNDEVSQRLKQDVKFLYIFNVLCR